MKSLKTTVAMFAAIVGAAHSQAVTYNDSVNDLFGGAGGGGILDISSVELNNNATDLQISIYVNAASITSPDWGKYTLGFDTDPGGDTTSPAGNPWGRNIRMSSGMDYWIGSWVDSGGGSELWKYTGSWANLGPQGGTITANSISYTIPLASLGLTPGETFTFDVYTTGGNGGDTAVDALSNPGIAGANWGDPYDSGILVSSYTVTPIPEPSALALIGLGGALLARRLIRRKV